jgi:hypothetical protein
MQNAKFRISACIADNLAGVAGVRSLVEPSATAPSKAVVAEPSPFRRQRAQLA